MSAPSRIVSLLPSATEVLFAIGAGDRVAGVTHECDHPLATRDLPAVTSNLLLTDGAAPGDIDRHIHAEVLAAQPEIMILMPCGYDIGQTLELVPHLASLPGFADLESARAGHLVVVNGSAYFSRPGPRIIQGLEIFAAARRAQPGDQPPEGAAYWNQPATSRIALIPPAAL